MERTERKRRVVRAFERYVQNPPIKVVLLAGIPTPTLALLETTGRVSGKPRRNPVIKGLVDHEFWIVAEHGLHAGYVKNLQKNPRVRIKMGWRWQAGIADVVADDDPLERARWLHEQLGRWHRFDVAAARIFGTEPVTVRVDLTKVEDRGLVPEPAFGAPIGLRFGGALADVWGPFRCSRCENR